MDVKGYEKVKSVADKCAVAYNAGDYGQSTRLWGETEGAISDTTGGVNLYNILKWNSSPMKSSEAKHASFKHKYLGEQEIAFIKIRLRPRKKIVCFL